MMWIWVGLAAFMTWVMVFDLLFNEDTKLIKVEKDPNYYDCENW